MFVTVLVRGYINHIYIYGVQATYHHRSEGCQKKWRQSCVHSEGWQAGRGVQVYRSERQGRALLDVGATCRQLPSAQSGMQGSASSCVIIDRFTWRATHSNTVPLLAHHSLICSAKTRSSPPPAHPSCLHTPASDRPARLRPPPPPSLHVLLTLTEAPLPALLAFATCPCLPYMSSPTIPTPPLACSPHTQRSPLACPACLRTLASACPARLCLPHPAFSHPPSLAHPRPLPLACSLTHAQAPPCLSRLRSRPRPCLPCTSSHTSPCISSPTSSCMLSGHPQKSPLFKILAELKALLEPNAIASYTAVPTYSSAAVSLFW